MKQVNLREGARRQHRVVSLYCVIQCWMRGLDGVKISRTWLERLLGLERFKKTRVEWMRSDFDELFPYQRTDYDYWPAVSFSSLELSRAPFDEAQIEPFKMWRTPSSKQLSELYEGFVPFFADAANYDERLLCSYLSLLAQGQISPHSVPPTEPE